MNAGNPTEENHRARSSFVRELVQRSGGSAVSSSVFDRKLPKRIVQFWDDLDRLPGDVGECIETWRKVKEQGVERLLFDKHQAREFIGRRLGPRYRQAYDKCYHPAMQSDYFRLCYIYRPFDKLRMSGDLELSPTPKSLRMLKRAIPR